MSYVRMPPTPGDLRAANEHITAMETRIEALEEALRDALEWAPRCLDPKVCRSPQCAAYRDAYALLSTSKE